MVVCPILRKGLVLALETPVDRVARGTDGAAQVCASKGLPKTGLPQPQMHAMRQGTRVFRQERFRRIILEFLSGRNTPAFVYEKRERGSMRLGDGDFDEEESEEREDGGLDLFDTRDGA